MTPNVKQALETIHAALNDNNVGLDAAIAAAKTALFEAGEKKLLMEKERLPQNNRQGRKMLQTYFKKRGVEVVYAEANEAA
jgi:hypothetical protein